MHTILHLAAMRAAGMAWAYAEHGFTPTYRRIDGLPIIQEPLGACSSTHTLARLAGLVAEAMAMRDQDSMTGRRLEPFPVYLEAAHQHAGAAIYPSSVEWTHKSLIGVTRHIQAHHVSIQALAEQLTLTTGRAAA